MNMSKDHVNVDNDIDKHIEEARKSLEEARKNRDTNPDAYQVAAGHLEWLKIRACRRGGKGWNDCRGCRYCL